MIRPSRAAAGAQEDVAGSKLERIEATVFKSLVCIHRSFFARQEGAVNQITGYTQSEA